MKKKVFGITLFALASISTFCLNYKFDNSDVELLEIFKLSIADAENFCLSQPGCNDGICISTGSYGWCDCADSGQNCNGTVYF